MIEQSEQIKRKPEMDVVADLCMSRGRRGAEATWGSRAGAGVREGAGGLASTGCWCCGGSRRAARATWRHGSVDVWSSPLHEYQHPAERGQDRGRGAEAARSDCKGGAELLQRWWAEPWRLLVVVLIQLHLRLRSLHGHELSARPPTTGRRAPPWAAVPRR